MLLFNEQHEQLNIGDVKAELQNLNDVPTPSLEEVQSALGDYYNKALQIQGANLRFAAELKPIDALAPEGAFLGGIGDKILDEIKKIICAILDDGSTPGQILDAVLSALSGIIPGGIFIETIAKTLVKYLLSTGIGAFCGVAPAAE